MLKVVAGEEEEEKEAESSTVEAAGSSLEMKRSVSWKCGMNMPGHIGGLVSRVSAQAASFLLPANFIRLPVWRFSLRDG